MAHLLGNHDYYAPCSSSSSSSSGGAGWTPPRRLALLSLLCGLAADTNALRGALEETEAERKKARVEANAIRSKARQMNVSMAGRVGGHGAYRWAGAQCSAFLQCIRLDAIVGVGGVLGG